MKNGVGLMVLLETAAKMENIGIESVLMPTPWEEKRGRHTTNEIDFRLEPCGIGVRTRSFCHSMAMGRIMVAAHAT